MSSSKSLPAHIGHEILHNGLLDLFNVPLPDPADDLAQAFNPILLMLQVVGLGYAIGVKHYDYLASIRLPLGNETPDILFQPEGKAKLHRINPLYPAVTAADDHFLVLTVITSTPSR
jgi:hypothetical protein